MPPTLVNCGSLKVLDLKENHLSSNISWSSIQFVNIQSLHLEKNKLSGELPSFFKNYTSLQTLDLSEKEFSGTLPSWIGVRLSNPRILQLRGITNFTAMRINRIINNTLDYGSNYYKEKKKLESNFIGLNALNLSVNQFFGKLPESIGSNQLDTLNDESMYVGNEGLCGYPLRKECKSDERDQLVVQSFGDEEFEDVFKMRWIYAAITHGFTMVSKIGFVGNRHNIVKAQKIFMGYGFFSFLCN
ncbi:probable LRR receptor-like serine/threonine-protein kinase At4g36180 [Aristolochia californica]|uniref:probable LRR receptor-like serine/threonine-protein kinase At4g36180 n=1 Tax=Aristolochia californica TaxID=171875 RepID=UPI0035DE935D